MVIGGKAVCAILRFLIRRDKKYSKLEAEILDLALILHAEHGGWNLPIMKDL